MFMEEQGINSSAAIVKGDVAPESFQFTSRSGTVKSDGGSESFQVGPRNENHSQLSGSPAAAAATTTTVAGAAPSGGGEGKKKRGRPRKYGQDGSVAMALSPMPISASIPLTGDYAAWKHNTNRPTEPSKKKKKHKLELENPGDRMAFSLGGNFTPHVITVSAGEDISMKIISFAQQGSRAICVLAANGAISNVTLRQPNSSGGTLTYEGRFEILSLTGSFMPSDNGLTKSRSGGMSVSLSGPDGRVLGGGLAGMLVAAGPVQVVVGSFLPGHHLEQKPKKQRVQQTPVYNPIPSNPISDEKSDGAHSGQSPNLATSAATFHRDNLPSLNSMQGSRISAIDENNNICFSREDAPRDHQSPSKGEVSY
nr:AT-hook motif nuclear-localized protein 1 [Ipomoea batatas]